MDSAVGQKVLTLTGAVTGSGNLSDPVVTVFADNPVFTGEAITLPVSDQSVLPVRAGMLRYRMNAQTIKRKEN